MEVVEGVGAVRLQGLLGDVVEQFLDEGVVGLFVGNSEFGDVAGAGEADLLPFVGDVFAHRINGLFVLGGTEAADGVELLEAKAEGIDD